MAEVQFPVKVMEPVRVEALPVGDYLYQVKWDGMRWITYKSSRGMQFQTKAQKVFTTRFPELDHSMNWLPMESMIDGEVVVLKEGAPHFPSLLRRIHSHSHKIPELEVEYIIFDVLFWEGQDWRNKPLSERLELLEQRMPASERCHRIETFSNGAKLWHGIEQLGLEGLVAKEPKSLYRGGINASWLKIKKAQEQTFLVGGMKFKGNSLQAVCLGMAMNTQFVYVGSVSNGVASILKNESVLTLSERSSSPFEGIGPKPSRGETIRWVEPTLPLKTRFLEWTEGGKLRHAQIIV
jgi:bifunctional non-homologous end joining protein LigD